MKPLLQFVSTLALGFFAAAVLAVGAANTMPSGLTGGGWARLDYGSVGIGVVVGVLISNITHVGWSDIPRRVASYVVSKRGTIQLCGWGAVFTAVLLLY